MRNFKYFISQGFGGIAKNGLMSVASISIVTASMIIFGVFILFGLNLNYISEQAINQIELFAEVERGTETAEWRNIGTQIEGIEGVREVILYSAEEQLETAKIQHADEPVIIARLERSNPFLDGYRVLLTNPAYAAEVESELRGIQNIYEVNADPDDIQWIVNFAETARMVSFWLVFLLGLISIFIISNTIKLGMFARRREINIMKYVGATNWFIRWPFVIEGIFIGLIGGVIAATIVLWGYGMVVPRINDFIGGIVDMAALSNIYGVAVLFLLSLGSGIGLIGSALSIRKYLVV